MLSVLLAAVVQGTVSTVRTTVPGFATYEGTVTKINGVEVELYRGIRFATAERFESPVPFVPQPPPAVTNATEFGASCLVSYFPDAVPAGESEDCLFLNVFKPAAVKRPLPVMIHFYDGGFASGTSAIFPVERLVGRSGGDVITVSFNYRLSAFGFLGTNKHRAADGSTGNWGLQDQRMVMQWVQKYIGAFGGNPRRVTLMGLSAGGSSVTTHLVTPKSRGLFKRAIMQSGLAVTWGTVPLERAEVTYQQLLDATNCTDIACLKAAPSQVVAAAADALFSSSTNPYLSAYSPTIDGVELTQHVFESIMDGDYDTTVDVLAGGVRDENAYFYFRYPFFPEQSFDSIVGGFLLDPADLDAVKELYKNQYEYPENRGGYNDWWWYTMAATSDASFWCQQRRALQAMAQHGTRKLYSYMLVHPTQQQTYCYSDGNGTAVVGHTADVAYQFNCPVKREGWTVDLSSCAFNNADEADLAWSFSGFWVAFAKWGRPGFPWHPVSACKGRTFIVDVSRKYGGKGFHYKSNVRQATCDFWDTQLGKAKEPLE